MKIAFKNFLTTLKRYKTASVLNIVGLTLAFMAFYIIMAQVVYNVSYNRSIEDSERVYLIPPQWSGENEWSSYSPRYTTEQAFKLCPDVEYGGSWRPEQAKRVYRRYSNYHFEPFDGGCCVISPSMFDVLSFKSVEGNLHDISKPDHVVISQSLAKRMDVSVGDVIYLPSMAWNATPEPEKPVTIAGIYKDFAPNTMMKGFDVVMYAGDDIASIKDNGMYDAIAKGFSMADGEIFAWLNADDTYFHWAFQIMNYVVSKGVKKVGLSITGGIVNNTFYNLIDDIYLDVDSVVNKLWK